MSHVQSKFFQPHERSTRDDGPRERDLSTVTAEDFESLSLKDRNRLLIEDANRYRALRDTPKDAA